MVVCRVTGRKAIIELLGSAAGTDRPGSPGETFSEACREISEREDVRVVAVVGSGDHPFSWWEDGGVLPAGTGGYSFRSPAETVGGLDLPVIVGVHGDALVPGWK